MAVLRRAGIAGRARYINPIEGAAEAKYKRFRHPDDPNFPGTYHIHSAPCVLLFALAAGVEIDWLRMWPERDMLQQINSESLSGQSGLLEGCVIHIL